MLFSSIVARQTVLKILSSKEKSVGFPMMVYISEEKLRMIYLPPFKKREYSGFNISHSALLIDI